ncbi:S-adenosylmethionine decarboxylase [Selenomonas sp. FOBRC6]|uniref:S-adenosylmethionine decarboxylase n=1 Tax=Selenomonas sp. FOBRC6 TaxID=936572 RepID=UPI0002781E17|nr:S-adenosylmethionine decarboxylase [Selenomonas sp. FOBRC6]EJO22981.1 S-adenosylmethionine decarboxylase [Selenomonas sp. FOBRC6]
MDIQSRLLTVDFYNCKADKCTDEEALRAKVSAALRELDLVPLQIISDVQESGHISLMALLQDGHLALHVHPELRHVSLDIYLCAEDAALDPIARTMRRAFQPEKTKTTHLRRGDFRSPTEIRPKTTTRVAPIRKIKSTGAKVIRILARRNRG